MSPATEVAGTREQEAEGKDAGLKTRAPGRDPALVKFRHVMDRLPGGDGGYSGPPHREKGAGSDDPRSRGVEVDPDALRGAYEFATRIQAGDDAEADWGALDEQGQLIACGRAFRQPEFGLLLRAKLAEQAYKAGTALELNRLVRAVAALPQWAFEEQEKAVEPATPAPAGPREVSLPSPGADLLRRWRCLLGVPNLQEWRRTQILAGMAEYVQRLGESREAAERFAMGHADWDEQLYRYKNHLRRAGSYVD